MSRTPYFDNGRLPALKSGYDESPRLTQRELVPVHLVHPVNRIDYLEEKLAAQEKTTAGLLERAYKIKEDLIDNLNFTHGTWQDEKQARELLQEHIRTITDVVRKLSKDIVALEQNIRFKEGQTEGTSSAVKNLEMHHVAGLTDIRGRVARCDSSIAKISSELKACFDSIKQVNQQTQDINSRLLDKFQLIEQRIGHLGGQLDKTSAEHTLQIKHVEGDYSVNLQNLDSKTRSLIEETRSTMNTYKLMEENERDKLESRLSNHIDRATSQREAKWDKFEKRVEDTLLNLTKRIQKLEDDAAKDRDRNASSIQVLESRLNNSLDGHVRRQKEEIDKLKRECREGFSTIHDSISHMKQVMEGKRKLLEEQLRKEIGQIRKLVVLI